MVFLHTYVVFLPLDMVFVDVLRHHGAHSVTPTHYFSHRLLGKDLTLFSLFSRCRSRGGGTFRVPPPPTSNVEAQIFAIATTLLRDVGKISIAHPPDTNPGSAPALCVSALYSSINGIFFLLHQHN